MHRIIKTLTTTMATNPAFPYLSLTTLQTKITYGQLCLVCHMAHHIGKWTTVVSKMVAIKQV